MNTYFVRYLKLKAKKEKLLKDAQLNMAKQPQVAWSKGEVDPLLFLCYDGERQYYLMDRDKLKLIIRNLELLVDSLKSEVYSDTQSYMDYDKITTALTDYDEVFEDDDGYPDWGIKWL